MWRTDELRNVLLRGERRVLVRVLHKLVRDLDQLRKHDHSCQFTRLKQHHSSVLWSVTW